MKLRKLFTDERAVSPVVGVALLIAIAVILAAVIGAVVLGLGTSGAEAPQASLNGQFSNNTAADGMDNITISHEGGDPLPADQTVVVEPDDTETPLNTRLEAGQSREVELGDEYHTGDEISVVWKDPNSESRTVLETFRVD